MPKGVYPDFADKKKTKPHPAKGLSKNKYDAKGNLRPPRASRSKLAKEKEKIGVSAQDDLQEQLQSRRGMFKWLLEDTQLEPDDEKLYQSFIDDPILLMTKSAGDLQKEVLENLRTEYDYGDEDMPNFLQLGIPTQDEISGKYKKVGVARHINKVVQEETNFKEADEVSYNEEGKQVKATQSKTGEQAIKYKKGVRGKGTILPSEIGVKGTPLDMRELIRSTAKETEALRIDERIDDTLMTSRGLVRKRAKRWDSGMTKEQKKVYLAKKKQENQGLVFNVNVAKHPHATKTKLGQNIFYTDEAVEGLEHNITADKPISSDAQSIMDDFFGEISNSYDFDKHMKMKYDQNDRGGKVKSKVKELIASGDLIPTDPAPAPPMFLDEEDINPTQDHNIAMFMDEISKSGKAIGLKAQLSQDIPPPQQPSYEAEAVELPTKKKKAFKFRIKKKPSVEWREGYIGGYAFSAKDSQFDTYEEALAKATEFSSKVAGITTMTKKGKTIYSLRKGHGGKVLKDPKGLEKSVITNPNRMYQEH